MDSAAEWALQRLVKRCAECSAVLPLTQFAYAPRAGQHRPILLQRECAVPSEFRDICIACQARAHAAQPLDWHLAQCAARCNQRSRSRGAAGENGLHADVGVPELRAQWHAQGARCALCGEALSWARLPASFLTDKQRMDQNLAKGTMQSVSVDRIACARDDARYSGNLRFVHARCNAAKMPADIQAKLLQQLAECQGLLREAIARAERAEHAAFAAAPAYAAALASLEAKGAQVERLAQRLAQQQPIMLRQALSRKTLLLEVLPLARLVLLVYQYLA